MHRFSIPVANVSPVEAFDIQHPQANVSSIQRQRRCSQRKLMYNHDLLNSPHRLTDSLLGAVVVEASSALDTWPFQTWPLAHSLRSCRAQLHVALERRAGYILRLTLVWPYCCCGFRRIAPASSSTSITLVTHVYLCLSFPTIRGYTNTPAVNQKSGQDPCTLKLPCFTTKDTPY